MQEVFEGKPERIPEEKQEIEHSRACYGCGCNSKEQLSAGQASVFASGFAN